MIGTPASSAASSLTIARKRDCARRYALLRYVVVSELRRACPCAGCAGEPDLFGRVARGPAPNYSPRSFEIRDFERVGNYALQPNWMDGHSSGMWTYERLREICPCEECRPA